MLDIDGSDGGGQLLRSALAVAALTGTPIHMTGIRGDRSTPGLRPQHLAVVELLADICDAECSAVDVGTAELTFEPGTVESGRYSVDIGTAGSIPLLFDAVLPLATVVDGPLVVEARGGTDVKWSPTTAYYRQTKVPLVRRHGLHAAVEVDRRGFYPAGGGTARLYLAPSTLTRIDRTERGALTGARVTSLADTTLAEASVAERQATQAVDRLDDAGLETVERTVEHVETDSPGSVLAVRLDYEHTLAGFDVLGEEGVPAESVADEAVDAALAFHDGQATVDRHAADQLLVFLALAGGRLRIPTVTDHVETNSRLLAAFGYDLAVEPGGERPVVRARA